MSAPKCRRFLSNATLLVAIILLAEASSGESGANSDAGRTRAAAGWDLLFNGHDLTGWHTFLQERGRDADPDGVVKIEDGTIHLYKRASEGSKVVMGYIVTEKEYGDYHLRLEYKWGAKKFEPRLALPRDAGLYFHIFGPDEVWPKSAQFQIQEGNAGDAIMLYGAQADTWIKPGGKAPGTAESMNEFTDPVDGGEPAILGGSGLAYQGSKGMYELEGWNTVEVIARGSSVKFVLNGKLVNRLENLRVVDANDPSASKPLARGRIALEIEAAEILYRNVEIRSLAEGPAPKIEAEEGLRVGAAAADIFADNDMEIAGGIGPWKAKGAEGELRATAVVIEKAPDPPCAIVNCDVLFVSRDLGDAAKAEIEKATGIRPENIMVSATHTHGAPSVTRVHGYDADPRFRKGLQAAIVKSAIDAHAKLNGDCRFEFAVGADYSVGENSRILLGDGTIFWGGPREDAVRPTAPFDPDLPVFAFRGKGGELRAMMFNHSTHTIGTPGGMLRSPAFYGLAAQELERKLGCVVAFIEGASGSTHNLVLTPQEARDRIMRSTEEILSSAKPRAVDRVRVITRPFKYRVRKYDEGVERAKVESYCRKRMPEGAEYVEGVFQKMRDELAPHQGEERETWLQAIRIGDVAIVGVPAEYFTVLGIDIKRRSPFAKTYVSELANDWIGYLPDLEGHKRGGYQTWMGLHSFCQEGTGEAVVEEITKMLEELKR